MAAKAWSTAQQKSQQTQKQVDEIFFQNDQVSLCLLIHRRAKIMRVIDFRAGPTPSKRMFVLSLAQREGVEKVYTLVERDEVSTWVKLGFAKEGNIPGFYKRSDAFLLGCSVHGAPHHIPIQSEMRIALGRPVQQIADVEEERFEVPATSAAHHFAEKTVVHAKKLAKELADKSLPIAKVVPIRENDVKKPLATALRAGRALTAFEPFGRDVQRCYFSITSRGGFELVASVESQACFGNAFVELLTSPTTET